MKSHTVAWILVIAFALWFVHVHYLRGVPVKRK